MLIQIKFYITETIPLVNELMSWCFYYKMWY